MRGASMRHYMAREADSGFWRPWGALKGLGAGRSQGKRSESEADQGVLNDPTDDDNTSRRCPHGSLSRGHPEDWALPSAAALGLPGPRDSPVGTLRPR